MKKFNSASRIYQILKEGAALPDNIATVKAWATLFQMDDLKDSKLSMAVSERLLWTNQEFTILENQVRVSDLTEDLYVDALSHIEQAFSTMHIAGTWTAVKQYLSQQTLIPLSYWANILPGEEMPIQQEELDEILKQVAELEDTLKSSILPDDLKLLIYQHTISIRRAMTQYPIAGARALKEAANSALGDLIDVKDIIIKNRQSTEVNSLLSLWTKTNQVADIAIKTDKLLKVGKNAWTYVDAILPNLPSYPVS